MEGNTKLEWLKSCFWLENLVFSSLITKMHSQYIQHSLENHLAEPNPQHWKSKIFFINLYEKKKHNTSDLHDTDIHRKINFSWRNNRVVYIKVLHIPVSRSNLKEHRYTKVVTPHFLLRLAAKNKKSNSQIN